MKKLLVIILLSGFSMTTEGLNVAAAQTHQTMAIRSSTDNHAKSGADSITTIATLYLDSLRLVVGLEEMQAHLARMIRMGRKAGIMFMDFYDTHVITITVFRLPSNRSGQSSRMTDNDMTMTVKVACPTGKSETREMQFVSGLESFNEGFNLSAKGKYRFSVLLEINGKPRRAEFNYEMK